MSFKKSEVHINVDCKFINRKYIHTKLSTFELWIKSHSRGISYIYNKCIEYL